MRNYILYGKTRFAKHLLYAFLVWGCPFSRKKLPQIAMGYDCTPPFFRNWMDDPETEKTEKGYLRVLGYAWRKHLEEEADPEPQIVKAMPAAAVQAGAGRKAA